MTAPVQGVATLHGEVLEQALAFGGNALLLAGPARVGKLALARAVAGAHNCVGTRGPYGEGCGACPSCRALALGAHPDVLEIHPRATTATGKAARRKLIPIGAILSGRDKGRDYDTHVYEFLEVRPTHKRRAVIVQGAEYLNPEAANALLKLVEEPPHRALFLFLAEDVRAVLPTIVSRSGRLGVPPAPDRVLEAALRRAGVEPAPELLAFAAGRAGVLEQQERVLAALDGGREFNAALQDGLLPALEAAERLEKTFDPEWHPEALRFLWRFEAPHVRAHTDLALEALQEALEAYASPSLSFQVFALNLREAFGEG